MIRNAECPAQEPMPRVVVIGSSNTDMTVRLPLSAGARPNPSGRRIRDQPGRQGRQPGRGGPAGGRRCCLRDGGRRRCTGAGIDRTLPAEGIDVEHVRVVGGVPSGVALIFVSNDGENMIGVAPGANQRLSPEDIERLPARCFATAMCCWWAWRSPFPPRSGRWSGKSRGDDGCLEPCPRAIALEPDDVRELLSAADIITPNRVEAIVLAGMQGAQALDISRCSRRLLELGSQGGRDHAGIGRMPGGPVERFSRIGTPRVEAVDTVGAGDAFSGALATALAETHSSAASRRLGQRRGGSGGDQAGRPIGFALPRGDRFPGGGGGGCGLSNVTSGKGPRACFPASTPWL